jgi:hypothetical protein
MKTWPTEDLLKKHLTSAKLLTLAAALYGIVMILNFTPVNVLVEIGLASCAILQWCKYFNTKTLIDIKALVSTQE